MKLRSILLSLMLLTGVTWAADDIAKDLEDHFRLYLIKGERRSQGDRVVVTGDKAVVYYWKSLNVRTPDEVICDAYEWLLAGRTTYGRGAKEAFDRYPSLQQIDISFYDLQFGTRKGSKRAEILPTQSVIEYLRVGVRRDSLSKKAFNRKEVKSMIENRQCVEVGRSFIDSVSINENYIKGKK
ncbi:MAG: hypothetical protein IT286_04965 [Proteobacteria bacterium]|jgi:hypothetical protein|nr:hypothetical protein [Pseudomonadota bacterium]